MKSIWNFIVEVFQKILDALFPTAKSLNKTFLVASVTLGAVLNLVLTDAIDFTENALVNQLLWFLIITIPTYMVFWLFGDILIFKIWNKLFIKRSLEGTWYVIHHNLDVFPIFVSFGEVELDQKIDEVEWINHTSRNLLSDKILTRSGDFEIKDFSDQKLMGSYLLTRDAMGVDGFQKLNIFHDHDDPKKPPSKMMGSFVLLSDIKNKPNRGSVSAFRKKSEALEYLLGLVEKAIFETHKLVDILDEETLDAFRHIDSSHFVFSKETIDHLKKDKKDPNLIKNLEGFYRYLVDSKANYLRGELKESTIEDIKIKWINEYCKYLDLLMQAYKEGSEETKIPYNLELARAINYQESECLDKWRDKILLVLGD